MAHPHPPSLNNLRRVLQNVPLPLSLNEDQLRFVLCNLHPLDALRLCGIPGLFQTYLNHPASQHCWQTMLDGLLVPNAEFLPSLKLNIKLVRWLFLNECLTEKCVSKTPRNVPDIFRAMGCLRAMLCPACFVAEDCLYFAYSNTDMAKLSDDIFAEFPNGPPVAVPSFNGLKHSLVLRMLKTYVGSRWFYEVIGEGFEPLALEMWSRLPVTAELLIKNIRDLFEWRKVYAERIKQQRGHEILVRAQIVDPTIKPELYADILYSQPEWQSLLAPLQPLSYWGWLEIKPSVMAQLNQARQRASE